MVEQLPISQKHMKSYLRNIFQIQRINLITLKQLLTETRDRRDPCNILRKYCEFYAPKTY